MWVGVGCIRGWRGLGLKICIINQLGVGERKVKKKWGMRREENIKSSYKLIHHSYELKYP